MNNHENASLYKIEDIKIQCDSKKINLVSSEVTLYSNYLIIKSKNETKNLKIFYQDITFHAIEKQKKMIIICDIKKYNLINFFCNSEDEMNEFFNQINTCINENNNINEDNIELNEETNYDKLLEEWEKKMVFNNYENDEENNENV